MTVPKSEWIQELPETGSDERMHVLDEGCWCKPTLRQYEAGFGFGYVLEHHAASRGGPLDA